MLTLMLSLSLSSVMLQSTHLFPAYLFRYFARYYFTVCSAADAVQELYSRARCWQMERSNILVVFSDEEPNQSVSMICLRMHITLKIICCVSAKFTFHTF